MESDRALKESAETKEEDNSPNNKGSNKNRMTPEMRCKIETMAGMGK